MGIKKLPAQKLTHYNVAKCMNLSNKAITEIENFFDWIVMLRVETEVPAKKIVTSLPGAIDSLKIDILALNKV